MSEESDNFNKDWDELPDESKDEIGEVKMNSVELVLSESAIDRLSPKQIQAALRMVQFPNASMQSIADSVGVSRQTIHNWKKDSDFKMFMSEQHEQMVKKTIDSRAKRNAAVFDAVHDELLSRMGSPTVDEDELKRILGDNYTQADLQTYRNRFISSSSMKDVFAIWSALEEKTRKDGELLGGGSDEMTILRKIQRKYEEWKIQKQKVESFESRTGFTYDVDFNEVDADKLYAAPDESTQGLDIDDQKHAGEETNLLDMFDAENT